MLRIQPADRTRRQARFWRHPAGLGLLCLLCCSPASLPPARAQATPQAPAGDPRSWAETAAQNQLAIAKTSKAGETPLRFRVRRVDAKGDITREVVEARESNVARLVERNGQPLTAEENRAEIERLQALRKNPDEMTKHRKEDTSARSYAEQLIQAIPSAMHWTYAPGQPQVPGVSARQVVLDFEPDPAYKPPTLVTETLTGLAGRLWVDAKTHCVVRVEGRILHQVDYGWGGVLARIKPGGTISFEQVEAAQQRWAYAHVEAHLMLRELLVHTASENTKVDAWDWHVLPAPMSFEQAIDALLAMNVPTR